jgi:hypothetical protein
VGSIIKLSIMVPKAFSATIYVKKKDGMSDDDFIDYYNTKQFILLHVGLISCAAVPGG